MAHYPIAAFTIQYDLIDLEIKSQLQDAFAELRKAYSEPKTLDIYKYVNERYNAERKYFELTSTNFKQVESYAHDPLDQLEHKIDYLSRSIAYDTTTINRVNLIFKNRLESYQKILSRVRQRLYSFLGKIEQRFSTGEINQEIFVGYRAKVDALLLQIAPDVLSKFNAVYRRIGEGDAEALSQAAASCRRILKAIADLVYPANNKEVLCADGKSRVLGDDKFINRLHQFVNESGGGSDEISLTRAEIGDLETRLKNLNALSSKGTHASVSVAAAHQCAIQTYLAAGDTLLLRKAQVKQELPT
jgi:hypothetical protein